MHQTHQDRQKQLINTIRSDVTTVTAQASVVPMQADYAGDPGRCLTSVMFVPPPIANSLQTDIQQTLAQAEPQHYYNPPQSMHITIKNVRVTQNPPAFDEADIAKVDGRFAHIVPRHPRFAFSFEELVLFPNSISLVGYSDASLRALVLDLDAGLNEVGLPDDKRYLSDDIFFGNITLCRFTHPPGAAFILAVEQLNRQWTPVEIELSNIELIVCNASAAPATIRRLHRYELRQELLPPLQERHRSTPRG